jgi:predicted nucleotidyltransferase
VRPAPWLPAIAFAQPFPFQPAAGRTLVVDTVTTASTFPWSNQMEGHAIEGGFGEHEFWDRDCTGSGGPISGNWGWNPRDFVPGGTFVMSNDAPPNVPSFATNAVLFTLDGLGSAFMGMTTPIRLDLLGLPSPPTCEWGIGGPLLGSEVGLYTGFTVLVRGARSRTSRRSPAGGSARSRSGSTRSRACRCSCRSSRCAGRSAAVLRCRRARSSSCSIRAGGLRRRDSYRRATRPRSGSCIDLLPWRCALQPRVLHGAAACYSEGVVEPEQVGDISSYVEGWRARARARARAAEERTRAIDPRLAEVVDRLVRDFGATRIVLFGSYARGSPRPSSDVDLLVYGLPPERLLEACVVADRVLGDVHADLVPASIARAEIVAIAEAEGRTLHG